MNRYGPKATKKIAKVMHEWKHGELRSGKRGSHGHKTTHRVTSREQAIAIGISEARREGDKVPKQK